MLAINLRYEIVNYRGNSCPNLQALYFREKIIESLNADWKSALEISRQTQIKYHAVCRILKMMRKDQTVSYGTRTWVDHKFRKREYYVYRHKDFELQNVQLLFKLIGSLA